MNNANNTDQVKQRQKGCCLFTLVQMILLLPLYLLINKKTRPFLLIALLGLGIFLGVRNFSSGGSLSETITQKQEQRIAKQQAEQLAKGDEYRKKGSDKAAIEYYKKAGEEGALRIRELHQQRVEYYFENGRYQEAMEYLTQETDGAFDQESACAFMMDLAKETVEPIAASAENLIHKSSNSSQIYQYEKKLTTVEEMLNTMPEKTEGKQELQKKIQVANGYLCLTDRSYQPDLEEVAELWKNCSKGSPEKELLTALQGIQDGSMDAVEHLQELTKNKDFTEYMIRMFLPDLYYIKTDSMEDYLKLYEISRWAEYQTVKPPVKLEDSFQDKSDLIRIGIDYHGPYMELTKEHVTQLKEACGKAPAGKILVLHRQQVFGKGTHDFCICTEILNYLPSKYIPTSLKEVEYVIYMDSSYYVRGQYEVGSKAIVETTKLTLYSTVTGKSLYDTSVKGEISNTMYYSGRVPTYYSAGSPIMNDALRTAVDKILESK